MNQCPISGASLDKASICWSVRFDDGRSVGELTKAVSEAVQWGLERHGVDDVQERFQEALRRAEYGTTHAIFASELHSRGLASNVWSASKNIAPSIVAGIKDPRREPLMPPDFIDRGLLALAALCRITDVSERQAMRLAFELTEHFLPMAERSIQSAKNRQGKKGPGLATKSELLKAGARAFDRRPYSWKECSKVLTDIIESHDDLRYELAIENGTVFEIDHQPDARTRQSKMKLDGLAKELNAELRKKFSE